MRPLRLRTLLALVLGGVIAAISWIGSDGEVVARIAKAVAVFVGIGALLPAALTRLERWVPIALARARVTITAGRIRIASLISPAPSQTRALARGEIQVRGRDALVQRVAERALAGEADAWCCYGFPGVGKSTVLREIANAVSAGSTLPRVMVRPYPLGPTRPTLCTMLEAMLRWPTQPDTDDLIRLEKLAARLDDSVVVLDQFPHDDADAISQLGWLITKLRERGARAFFVLAVQEKPVLPSSIECVELRGLDLEAFTAYCADVRRIKCDQQPFPDQRVAELHERTGGNPQLAAMAITSARGEGDDLEVPEGPIESRVWSQTTSEERGVLHVLAALHKFEAEVPESELAELVPDWARLRIELVKRSLDVSIRRGTFKAHDLINNYVRAHDDAAVRAAHEQLVHFYAESPYFTSDVRHVRLAASHCAECRSSETFVQRYTSLGERLRSAGHARVLRALAEAGAKFGRQLPEDLLRAVRGDLAWSLAQLGETERALELFTELLIEAERRDEGQASDAAERATLMRNIADCRRLRGDVTGAERDVGHAARILRDRGLETTRECVACLLDHAHCRYLAADPDASLARLETIKVACVPDYEAEWWYRLSKAQRLRWDVADAIMSARRALQLAKARDSAIGIAKAAWGELAAQRLSIDIGDAGAYEEAIRRAGDVEQMFADLGYRAAVFVHHDLADLLRMAGHHEEALGRFERTLELTAGMGEVNREAHSWLGIAETIRSAGGALSSVGGSDHLRAYDEARSRYEAMRNAWGTAISVLGHRLSCGIEPDAAAGDVLIGSCCRGERGLVLDRRQTVFPLNFV